MEIFDLEFMRRAFIAGLLVGAVCPALGTFLVLQRLSLIADSLSHVALAGVAIGLLTRVYPPLTALGASVLAAAGIQYFRASGRLYGEAALALSLYTGLGLAVILISLARGFNVDLFSYLFGSILSVRDVDLALIGTLAAVIVGFVVLFYQELVQATFDQDLAKVSGVHVGRVNLLLAVLTAATVTLAMRVVGVLLVGALMVIPVLASLQVVRGFRATIFLSMGIGVLSVLVGLFAAYYAGIAASGAIVLASLTVLGIVSLLKNTVLQRRGAKPSLS